MMEHITKLIVSLQFEAKAVIEVGELVSDRGGIYFRYYPGFASHGLHSMMVAGESADPTREHLMKLAQYFKINNGVSIIESVQSVVRNWTAYASACGVGRRSKNEIQRVIGQ